MWEKAFRKKLEERRFESQPPSLENPFVGIATTAIFSPPQKLSVSTSKPGESLCGCNGTGIPSIVTNPVSTSNPGESLCGLFLPVPGRGLVHVSTSKPGESLCGLVVVGHEGWAAGLNLQAWRIPLWAIDYFTLKGVEGRLSQPPSLENPFVGHPDV